MTVCSPPAEAAQPLPPDRPLRLFVLGPRAFPGMQGGVEHDCEVMCAMMAEEGVDVTALTMRRYQSLHTWKGVRFIRLPTPNIQGVDKVVYNLLGTLACLWHRPDGVLVVSITSALFLIVLRWAGIPVILRMVSRDYLHGKWGFVARQLIRWGECSGRFAHQVVCNSYSHFSYLTESRGWNNVRHVPPGMPDAEDFVPPAMDAEILGRWGLTDGGFILAVGRLTEEKGLDLLVAAFIETLPDNSLTLVVVGEGEGSYADGVRGLAVGQPQIVLAGQMLRREIGALYRHCRLFVLPSRFEGMPNALLEAIFFDCDLLVSDIPATQELALDPGCYFPCGDGQALVDRLSEGAHRPRSPSDYAAIRARHDWRTATRALITLFRENKK